MPPTHPDGIGLGLNRSACSLVHFTRGTSLPLPGLHGVTVHTLSQVDHGLFFGTLGLWVHLTERVLEIEMQADRAHLRVWVPLEQVASYVLDLDTP